MIYKVKDLIDELQKYDSELEVLCYIEEEEPIITEEHPFRLLALTHLETTVGEKLRSEDGIASMKFGRSENSVTVVTLSVTSIF